MRAREHTVRFLAGWQEAGITLADLAVRRAQGAWIWHRALCLNELPLGWARAENARGSDIYIRPARGHSWPLVFLDDIPLAGAREILTRMSGIAIHTSPQGGAQLWLACTEPLDESARFRAQRLLAREHSGDPGSTSGEHLGRLPGVRNWKRAGVWVNVLGVRLKSKALDVKKLADDRPACRHPGQRAHAGIDSSRSAKEWGWVCGSLEAGVEPDVIYRRLVRAARARRGADAERYAQRTVERALRHTH